MDTFVLLDRLAEKINLLDLVELPGAMSSSWTGIVAIERRIRRDLGAAAAVSATTEFSVEELRKAGIFRACETAGVDLCAIFDEEEIGKIPLGRLIYGLTTMHILSQDKNVSSTLTDEQTHELMWMMLVNTAGINEPGEASSSTRSAFVVPAATVRLWIDAMTCLGIVRGYQYLHRGAILPAEPCSSRLFETWLSDAHDIPEGRLVSKEAFGRLLSKVEYNMFWNRNKQRFKAIEFYRKQDRQVDYLRSIEEQKRGGGDRGSSGP